jgi:hypothetical protein
MKRPVPYREVAEEALYRMLDRVKEMAGRASAGRYTPRVEAIARALAKADGIEDPDQVVLGFPGSAPCTIGVGLKLRVIDAPIYPAWVWYAEEAKAAIEVVEAHPE